MNLTKTTPKDLKFSGEVEGKVYGLKEKKEHLWRRGKKVTCQNERKKKEGGSDDA